MSTLKSFICGVSNYDNPLITNLPFCKNDMILMINALKEGLNVTTDNIISLGLNGYVSSNTFLNSLRNIENDLDENDTLIFYYSGHGETKENNHYLIFSDAKLSTQYVIDTLETINIKSKIILLDCCYSGNFKINDKYSFDMESTVEMFQGEGSTVFASSKSDQVSYSHSSDSASKFTGLLCDAIQDKLIRKKGKVSFHDIQRLTSLYLQVWNKNNPEMSQHPIYRSSMSGTVIFDVEKYEPYQSNNFYAEYEKYTIYSVESSHVNSAKRFSVKLILKEPFSFEEIAKISKEVVLLSKDFEVYSSEISQKRWSGKKVNNIWIYFGRDESDIKNNNFLCYTLWVDDKQDKSYWYNISRKNSFLLDGIYFHVHTYYEHLKKFRVNNTLDTYDYKNSIKKILTELITLAEKVISLYQEYKNETFGEDLLIEEMQPMLLKIEALHLESSELELPPDELYDWSNSYMNLIATIHDFVLYYSSKHIEKRTKENRDACMGMTIRNYYLAIAEISELENK